MGDGLAHAFQQRHRPRHRRVGPAHHDAERRSLGADLSAGYRRVHVVHAPGGELFGEALGREGRDRAHVDDQLAAVERLAEAARSEQHLLDLWRVRQHQDHRFGAFGDLAITAADGGALRRDVLGHGAGLGDEKAVSRLQQVTRHGPAHDAQSDKSDVSHALD